MIKEPSRKSETSPKVDKCSHLGSRQNCKTPLPCRRTAPGLLRLREKKAPFGLRIHGLLYGPLWAKGFFTSRSKAKVHNRQEAGPQRLCNS